MNRIKIGNKIISEDSPIFYIAEAGVNHNGSLKIAKKLVDIAKEAGADAVKFQSFLADEIIIPKGPKAQYHIDTTGDDNKQTWYELLKSQEISEKMHKEIISYCKKKKILFLSTPYDNVSANLLNKLKMPAYKIASTDNDNFPFIKFIAKKKKPMIISTAMSTIEDVEYLVKTLKKINFNKFALLQCTGNYPSKIEDSNLEVIKTYKEKFNCIVGLSDHTPDNIGCITAVGMGIKIIEKHFTLDQKLYGPDHRMSLTPGQLKKSINEIRKAELSLGSKYKVVLNSELANRKKLKKSLVTSKDLKKGHKIDLVSIKIKRPGSGIRPKDLNKILGLKVNQNLKKDTVLKKRMFFKK